MDFNLIKSTGYSVARYDSYIIVAMNDRQRSYLPVEVIQNLLPSNFIIGEPKATEHYTVDQLKGFGMVGLYKKDDDQCYT